MKWNMKHATFFAATSLIALTNSIYANGESAQIRNLENRVTALEQRKGASGMINPQGRPQVRNGADLFVTGDLIYWNTHENGLPVAVKSANDTSLDDSQVKTIHGKWNFGFRVGVGYNTPHDGWDIRLTWLRYTDNGRKSGNGHGDEVFFTTLIHPNDLLHNLSAAAGKFKSRLHLRLDQLDLDLGREFFVSKWLTLRPHFGLRTDWLRQKEKAEYDNFVPPTPNTNADAKLKDHWYGIGLEGGLDTQWGLGCGWSLFGNLSAAILYGFHHIDFKTNDQPTDVEFIDLKDSYRVSHPILDLAMGVRWDNMFYDDRLHLGLQVGWEHHIYFSQNQFPVFVNDPSIGVFASNQGDLALQGWTFSARFDF